MLGFLSQLLDVLLHLPQLLLWALVTAVNLLVAALGTVLAAALSLLPGMPDAPSAPAADWIGWMNYFLPVAPLLAGLTVFVGLWITYLGVRTVLRWVKAL